MKTVEIQYSHPNINDGAEIYRLIKSCPPLDINSQYCYHIVCHDFSNTCVVARNGSKIAGFISAYLKPENHNCLFVWQVAITSQARGRGLASGMLEWLVKQSKYSINSLETTISPSNTASQKLFQHFARDHKADCLTSLFLDVSHFDNELHEEEILYRVSPLDFKKTN